MSGSAKRRGRRERQLGGTQSAPSNANSNLETKAGASHLSKMNNNQLLQHAFRNAILGSTSVPHPGRWETDLTFLMSDKLEASTYHEAADLSTVKKSFSISTYLSPAGIGQLAPKVILHNGGPIDGTLLACLALNEECRREGTGVFYHLPPRQNQEIGHASDLVFMLERWTRKDKYRWDKAGWSKRSDMYGIDEKCLDNIDSSDLLIPVCVRILQFDEPPVCMYNPPTAADPSQELTRPVLPNYSTDPAVRANVYQYSRPLQDLATYVILYPSVHTYPLACATSIFEDKMHSTREPTPRHFSEVFTLRYKCDALHLHSRVAQAMYQKSQMRHLATPKPMPSNAEVVECLVKAWRQEADGDHVKEMMDNGDKVRYFWQELKNMMNTRSDTRELISTWPKSSLGRVANTLGAGPADGIGAVNRGEKMKNWFDS